jgi:dTDP-glucose pyrophosphorylase
MAGEGTRFKNQGYAESKPFIPTVTGKSILEMSLCSLDGLRGSWPLEFIFIARADDEQVTERLRLIDPDCQVILLDEVTEGAVCTVLKANRFIDNNERMCILNSDQHFVWNCDTFLDLLCDRRYQGGVLVFDNNNPKWSYAQIDDHGDILRVAEKQVISRWATVGLYYWRKGKDFVNYAKHMINKNIRVNNEFYVCPVYNEAISDGLRIKSIPVSSMYGLGTPEDLEIFNGHFGKRLNAPS